MNGHYFIQGRLSRVEGSKSIQVALKCSRCGTEAVAVNGTIYSATPCPRTTEAVTAEIATAEQVFSSKEVANQVNAALVALGSYPQWTHTAIIGRMRAGELPAVKGRVLQTDIDAFIVRDAANWHEHLNQLNWEVEYERGIKRAEAEYKAAQEEA